MIYKRMRMKVEMIVWKKEEEEEEDKCSNVTSHSESEWLHGKVILLSNKCDSKT